MCPSGEQGESGAPAKKVKVPGIFAALTASERTAISGFFTETQVPAGGELWSVGAPGDYLACILGGSVELKVDTEFPGKQIVVGVFNAGTVIGASCVVDELPRSTTAKALEPTTLLLLNRENFTALTQAHAQVGVKLLKGILLAEANRLRKAYARLASIF